MYGEWKSVLYAPHHDAFSFSHSWDCCGHNYVRFVGGLEFEGRYHVKTGRVQVRRIGTADWIDIRTKAGGSCSGLEAFAVMRDFDPRADSFVFLDKKAARAAAIK